MKKKLLPLLAFASLISAALLPVSAAAASYNPGYTCYYRDIAGSCLSYQVQNPHFFNPQTYPFHTMFNAQSTTQNTWDNRMNNEINYYRALPFESQTDDNDYIDDHDDVFHIYKKNNRNKEGTYNRYRYQNDDYYEEYEHTRYYNSN